MPPGRPPPHRRWVAAWSPASAPSLGRRLVARLRTVVGSPPHPGLPPPAPPGRLPSYRRRVSAASARLRVVSKSPPPPEHGQSFCEITCFMIVLLKKLTEFWKFGAIRPGGILVRNRQITVTGFTSASSFDLVSGIVTNRHNDPL